MDSSQADTFHRCTQDKFVFSVISTFMTMLHSGCRGVTAFHIMPWVALLLIALCQGAVINNQVNSIGSREFTGTNILKNEGIGTTFETSLLFFTIRKFMSDVRRAPTTRRLYLNRLIVMDSIAYYSLLLTTYSVILVLWLINPATGLLYEALKCLICGVKFSVIVVLLKSY
ncbi:hypothetical protein BDQ17DRAFT_1327741 [Cyathus striatus]|nr:hypothetical protein BDQ17DRAFT_1327741 [Cyathus striatus]